MYLPQSAIIETGYAQQGAFVISSNKQPYSGYYHKDNKKRYWSGENHNSNSILLINLAEVNSLNNKPADYSLKNNVISAGFTKHYDIVPAPTLYKGDFIIPTEEEYNNGYFTRYIAQLKSSISPYIVEITGDNYAKLIQTEDKFFYNTAEMLWKLTGPLDDIFEDNIRIEPGIRDTNLRSLQQAEKKIPGLSKVFNNPLQFYY
jgi:hypothetical protein